MSIGLATLSAATEADPPIQRDPFWPVGYSPATQSSSEEEVIPALEWPTLPVRGYSRAVDGTIRALIQDVGIVSKNEVVSIFSQGYWFHWHIDEITPDGVHSTPLGISKDPSPNNIISQSIENISQPARR